MSTAAFDIAARAAKLRSDFDRAFAAPARVDTAIKQDLLAVCVGAEPYAVRLSEIGGLFVDRRIMPVPGGNMALLGIAGFRGSIVPVYSLPKLLGHASTAAPRWLVIAAAAPVALAFDRFEGHLRAAADAIVPQQASAQTRGHAPEFTRSAGVVRPVLHLGSIIKAVGAAEPAAVSHVQE